MSDDAASMPPARGAYRPLYAQVRDALVKRLVDGVWLPAQMLPSEFELAGELGVSQGTVRKALDALAAENLVVRRQGRGTFVAEHDEARILFQFFKLLPDSGEAAFPESKVVSARLAAATDDEARVLGLETGADVYRIGRVRSLGGRPIIAERVTLPAALFPGLIEGSVPNNLYGLYASRYGVTVARAHERLKAVALSSESALLLEVGESRPALLIDRVAFALSGEPVEWRVSHCLTDDFHYSSDLK